jgi:hypothetical protein
MLVSLREIKFIEFNNNSNRNKSGSESGSESGSGSGYENGNGNGYKNGSGSGSGSENRNESGNESGNESNFLGGGLQNESRFFKLVSVNGKEVDGGRYELPSKTKSGKPQTR